MSGVSVSAERLDVEVGDRASEPTSAGRDGPLADPISEARRLIDAATQRGFAARALGGVAVCMLSPAGGPLLPRALKDIDLVTSAGDGPQIARLLEDHGYLGEEMFNALRGAKRQLHRDPVNGRDLDVFIGEFEMCHTLPVAQRLDRERYTVPAAELLLTKLQIVELNERDERDICSICFQHEVRDGSGGGGIEAGVIADLLADDWGLWRTCKGTIERCRADVASYGLERDAAELIVRRLEEIWERVEAAPKSGKWKRRSRLGERKRWYREPEEE